MGRHVVFKLKTIKRVRIWISTHHYRYTYYDTPYHYTEIILFIITIIIIIITVIHYNDQVLYMEIL
jgi:hypothetical protein